MRLGVGVGGEFPQEFEASGVPVNRRGALIECVAGKADPLRMMAEQLVAKGIANERWVHSVGESFTKLLRVEA